MIGLAFHEMRQELVARGLLDSQLRLTDAGHTHVRAIIAELCDAVAPCNPDAPRVFWRIELRNRRRGRDA